jgi:hypothetical protein
MHDDIVNGQAIIDVKKMNSARFSDPGVSLAKFPSCSLIYMPRGLLINKVKKLLK